MIEFFNYLNAIHPLSDEATAALMKVVRAKELRKGQVWLQEGAVCDKFTFVIKGLMKMYFEMHNKEIIISLAKEQSIIFSLTSFFTMQASRFTIRAAEPAIIVYISAADLNNLAGKFREFTEIIKNLYEQQLIEYEAHLTMLSVHPSELLRNAGTQGRWILNGSRLTDKMLASFLGVYPNAVCIWRQKGWLD